MAKDHGQAIRRKAISELERLSKSLDEAFDITADMTVAEIEQGLREMGVDPHALPPLSLGGVFSEERAPAGPAYAFVSGDPLRDEPAPVEVKLLILKLRLLAQQQRYPEALELAARATLLAPDYWRAWISFGGLLILTGRLDDGEAIYHRARVDFAGDPKAVAAALHGCACVKEIRCKLNPSAEDLREVASLYEEALELDGTRTSTRACLVISSLLSRQTDKGRKLFEDSLLCEGFFDSMLLELGERGVRNYGAKMYKVMQALPLWFRNLLYGAGPRHSGSPDTSTAY
jgi:tetratricopeptide (TPR) repeat protein